MFKRKLFGSLAFRVLLTSFIFIIAPLIFYALVIYNRDYEEKLTDVFQEMHIFQKDQANLLLQIQDGLLNFIDAFHQMSRFVEDPTTLDPILEGFAHRGHLSALFRLSRTPDSHLICVSSTLPEYKQVDFTPYFDLDYLKNLRNNTFVGKDPIFGYSLFITFPLVNAENRVMGILGASIGLNHLLTHLMEQRSIYKATLSILTKSGDIIASSDPNRLGKRYLEVSDLDTTLPPNVIGAKRVPSIGYGFEFYLGGQKRFLTLSKIPYTEADLALSIPASEVLVQIYRTLWHLASLLAFILIVGGFVSFFLTLRFARPLSALSHVMGKVGEGHLEERFEKDIMGFEINYLGETFNQMITSLISYIEEAKREKASKEVYLKELQIGHEIQESILPEGKIDSPYVVAAPFFQAAKEVAGDFYDWLITEDHILITIADGVGKGISACLYSFDLRSVIRAFGTTTHDLVEIAKKTNTIFCQDTKETGNFVTAFLALYHPPTRELSFINCGHNYPIVKRASGYIERLEVSGLAFGIEEFDTITLKKITLNKGDFVIFYTDGLTDAQDSHHRLFGEKRFIETITKCPLSATPEELIQFLIREIHLFTEGEEQFDDMTLLILKVK